MAAKLSWIEIFPLFKALFLVLVMGIGLFLWKNLATPKTVGVAGLAPCPKSPNCVSCQAKDEQHYIPPFPYTSDALDRIERFLKENYIAQVVTKTPTYMHVVVTTKIFRFKDDLEFLVEKDTICVRSASRVGYSDLNTNRSRIEQIRQFL